MDHFVPVHYIFKHGHSKGRFHIHMKIISFLNYFVSSGARGTALQGWLYGWSHNVTNSSSVMRRHLYVLSQLWDPFIIKTSKFINILIRGTCNLSILGLISVFHNILPSTNTHQTLMVKIKIVSYIILMNIHLETFESAVRSLSRDNYGHGESSHRYYRVKVYEGNKSAKHLVGWMVSFSWFM